MFIYSSTISPTHTQCFGHSNLIEKRSGDAKAQEWEDVTKGEDVWWVSLPGRGSKNMAAQNGAWPLSPTPSIYMDWPLHLPCPHHSSWLPLTPSPPSLLCLQPTSCRARPISLPEPCFSTMSNAITKLVLSSGSISGEGSFLFCAH